MKLLIINASGNAGKSTLAYHLLKPNLSSLMLDENGGDVTFLMIESQNEGTTLADKVIGTLNQSEIMTEIYIHDNLVLDIGSADFPTITTNEELAQIILDEMDYIFIPVMPNDKIIADSIRTCHFLISNAHIDVSKIRIIFNGGTIKEFEQFKETLAKFVNLGIDLPAVSVKQNELIPMLSKQKQTVYDIVPDDSQKLDNFKQTIKNKIAGEIDPASKKKYAKQLSNLMLSVALKSNLDEVFNDFKLGA